VGTILAQLGAAGLYACNALFASHTRGRNHSTTHTGGQRLQLHSLFPPTPPPIRGIIPSCNLMNDVVPSVSSPARFINVAIPTYMRLTLYKQSSKFSHEVSIISFRPTSASCVPHSGSVVLALIVSTALNGGWSFVQKSCTANTPCWQKQSAVAETTPAARPLPHTNTTSLQSDHIVE